MTIISMISAVAENGVIGANNDMPWHISTDLKFFKATTMGKPVIMGRRTLGAIGKPLPGRENIVITRSKDFRPEGVHIVSSLEEAFETARDIAAKSGVDEIMVIGGGQIYREAMPQASKLYITRVHAEPEGDTRFPEIREAEWNLIERTPFERGPKDSADTSLEIFERRST